MITAYSEDYLYDAMRNLGGMLEFAVNDCGYRQEDYFQMFIISGTGEQFATGNPRYVAGMSGEELVYHVVRKSGLTECVPQAAFRAERTPEYWCGWILAYYQWKTCKSFGQINRECPFSELLQLYPVLHEASEEKAAEVLMNRAANKKFAAQGERTTQSASAVRSVHTAQYTQTQLQRLRSYAGLTQAALAEQADVSLRSVQMYEQRQKDINKAQAASVHRLAAVLGCRAEDLLEW